MAKFNIDATLHRLGKGKIKFEVWTRRYARIETAVRRCTEFMVLEGEVGDVIEFYLRLNGYQVGTVRMMATGRLDVVWNDRRFLKQTKTSKTSVRPDIDEVGGDPAPKPDDN